LAALGQILKILVQASHVRLRLVRRACPLHCREQKRPTRTPERNSIRSPQNAHVITTVGLRIDARTQSGEQKRLAAWRNVAENVAPHC
jgi:hypothetical protein